MTPDEFTAKASHLLGGHGWQARMARAFNANTSTVGRWASGRTPVPGEVQAVLELLALTPKAYWPERWFTQTKRTYSARATYRDPFVQTGTFP
jgi:hypothetical protein